MTNLAIFEFIAIAIALPLSYGLAWYFRNSKEKSYMHEVDQIFHQYWNGKPESELYAWQMVKRHYFYNDTPEKYLKYIREKIESLNNSDLLSDFYIDKAGNLRQYNSEIGSSAYRKPGDRP